MYDKSDSIFRRYYSSEALQDRFLMNPEDSVDMIIPIVHTNELWQSNLLSFYREIPMNRLLIGDGGCIDDSIEIVRKFPRVEVFDHRNYDSLGYSIRKLIEAVETEWFVYVHSDVYLPRGWFDAMKRHQAEYDWFGCSMQHTVMVEYQRDYGQRPWAGSQMGRKVAFEEGLARIDDDYVYRQEDLVLTSLVKQAGYRHGKVEDTFHYHQTMFKASPSMRKIKRVSIEVEMSGEEEVRTHMMQAKGIIKYLKLSPYLSGAVVASLNRLLELGELNRAEFKRWVAETNPAWLPYIRKGLFKLRLKRWILAFLRTANRLPFG